MALSARKAQTAGPGRWSDGRGLILSVKDSGRRSWLFRYTFDGRRREIGIGAFPEVALAEAREKAADLRRIVSAGRDPLQERDRPRGLAFREAAAQLIEHKRPGWRNAKHAAQWSSTLATYVYPRLGDRSVDAVTAHDVLEVLRPIWSTKPETASRVRQRIEAVIDYATTIGARSGENPARWRGHLANHAQHACADRYRRAGFPDRLLGVVQAGHAL